MHVSQGTARADPDRVRAMTDCLRHRGPDGDGYWSSHDGAVAFGHRRLAIIDLDTGAQPMLEESGRFCVVFNGEIYNYIELRRQLETEGVGFRTQSDTEVLLRLLQRDWTGALQHVIGMFAFAAWDAATGELILARDPIGEKPLYFANGEHGFVFASSFTAMQCALGSAIELDLDALTDYLMLGYVPAPRTIDRRVSKLPAGTLLRVRGCATSMERYWQPGNRAPHVEPDYDAAVEQLRELLIESVRIRLRSDVPLGVFLSGGVDSSLITAIAAREGGTAVRSFSVGFDERSFDESSYAAAVARHLGTHHTTLRAEVDVLDLLPQAVAHHGEPFGDSSGLAVWSMAAEARRHVTVVLGGDGGDETFAGYPWYSRAGAIRRLHRLVRTPATLAARSLGRSGVPAAATLARVQRGARMLSLDEAAAYAALRSHYDPLEAQRLFRGELRARYEERYGEGRGPLAAIFRQTTGSQLRRMRAVDLQSYLAECLLPKVDVATMAHGLELRSPLLDPRIVDFALALPDRWLIDRNGGKRILKDVLRSFIPAELFVRPKQGFSMPLQVWFRGPLRRRLGELGHSDRLGSLGLLSMHGVRALVDDHYHHRRDNSQRLYHLLILDEWLRAQ